MNHLESKIQSEICKRLQAEGIFFHSVPNEAAGRDKIRQSLMVSMGLRKGVGDLIVWIPVSKNEIQISYIEVKSETGKQSEQQIAFENLCNYYRVPYMVVRSVEEIDELIGKIKASGTLWTDFRKIWLESIRNASKSQKGEITNL